MEGRLSELVQGQQKWFRLKNGEENKMYQEVGGSGTCGTVLSLNPMKEIDAEKYFSFFLNSVFNYVYLCVSM